jgi:hypothetical protein
MHIISTQQLSRGGHDTHLTPHIEATATIMKAAGIEPASKVRPPYPAGRFAQPPSMVTIVPLV